MIPTLAWKGYYNDRVTKHVFEMPYQTWYRTYVGGGGSLTDVAIQANPSEPPPPVVRGIRPAEFDPADIQERMARLKVKKRALIAFHAPFYLPGALALALLGLPKVLRDRWMLMALGAIVVVTIAVFSSFSSWAPHYSAPVARLVAAIVAAGLVMADLVAAHLKGQVKTVRLNGIEIHGLSDQLTENPGVTSGGP